MLSRGADEMQEDGWSGAGRGGMHQRSHLKTLGSSAHLSRVKFCMNVRNAVAKNTEQMLALISVDQEVE
jgi:hypothetical protein